MIFVCVCVCGVCGVVCVCVCVCVSYASHNKYWWFPWTPASTDLIFIVCMQCVFREVGSGALNIIYTISSRKLRPLITRVPESTPCQVAWVFWWTKWRRHGPCSECLCLPLSAVSCQLSAVVSCHSLPCCCSYQRARGETWQPERKQCCLEYRLRIGHKTAFILRLRMSKYCSSPWNRTNSTQHNSSW